MVTLFKKINHVRRNNKNKIWLVHISVIAIIFLLSYLPKVDFVVIPRIFSFCYLCICIYFIKSIYSDRREDIEKYFYLIWVVILHSLFFITIEIEEKGLTYFVAVMMFNVLLSLLSIHKSDFILNNDFVGVEKDSRRHL